MVNVELCKGLERIGSSAFEGCSSLEQITIPSTVTFIDTSAFEGCSGLVSIAFCEEMEQLVNEVTFPEWNNGKSKESSRIYSLLAQHNIPAQLGTMKI